MAKSSPLQDKVTQAKEPKTPKAEKPEKPAKAIKAPKAGNGKPPAPPVEQTPSQPKQWFRFPHGTQILATYDDNAKKWDTILLTQGGVEIPPAELHTDRVSYGGIHPAITTLGHRWNKAQKSQPATAEAATDG